MAGTLTASVIKNDTTSPPAFQNSAGTEIGTLCRAWVNFNGYTSPYSIRASFNVSSITRTAVGRYQINFTNALPDANYAVTGSCQNNGGINSNVIFGSNSGAVALSSTGFEMANYNSANATFDTVVATIAIFR